MDRKIAKRKVLRTNFTKICNQLLEKFKNVEDKAEIIVLFEKCEQNWLNLNEFHSEIIDEFDDDNYEKELEAHLNYQDKFFEVRSKYNIFVQNSKIETNANKQTNFSSPKLPELKLPTFEGNYLECKNSNLNYCIPNK